MDSKEQQIQENKPKDSKDRSRQIDLNGLFQPLNRELSNNKNDVYIKNMYNKDESVNSKTELSYNDAVFQAEAIGMILFMEKNWGVDCSDIKQMLQERNYNMISHNRKGRIEGKESSIQNNLNLDTDNKEGTSFLDGIKRKF